MAKKEKEVKEKKKGKKLPVVLAVVVVIVIIASIGGGGDDGSGDDASASNSVSSVSGSSVAETPVDTPEPNTSAMVDYIASEAKKSANQSSSEEKRDEALNYISSTYPDYFTDNETMEKTMYYGYYLEYAYAKNGSDNLYANLGIDTYQVVKYIYRNAETADSDYTKENLRQIKETLSELGYTVK